MVNTLKKINYFLLGLSVITPLVFYELLFYPFVTTKVVFFRVIVLLALLVYWLYLYKKGSIELKITKVVWFLLAFFVVSILSTVFSVSPVNSFWSNQERADGLYFLIHLVVYFFLLISYLKERVHFNRFFRSSIVVALLVTFYGLGQLWGLVGATSSSGERMASTLGNPAYLGSYLLINVFFALYLLSRDRKIYLDIFYLISILFFGIGIFLTQTRGALLGLVFGLVVTAILSVFRSNNKVIRNVSYAVIVLMIAFLGIVFDLKNSEFVQNNGTLNRISSISFDDYTTKTRLLAWEASLKAFGDRPVLGWGPETYGYAFSKYFPPEIYVNSGSKIWFDKAHSIFFEVLVGTGFLGVVSYFGLWFFTLFYVWKSKNISKFESNIWIGLILGYLFADMFVFDTVSTYFLLAVIWAFANNIGSAEEERKFRVTGPILGALGVLVVFLLVLGYTANVKAFGDNKKLLMAQLYTKEASSDASYYKLAYDEYVSLLKDNDRFTKFENRRYLAVFARESASNFANYDQAVMFDFAIDQIQRSIEQDPKEIRHYYNLSQLYLNSYKLEPGRLSKIIEMKDKMIELSPNRAHTYYQIGEAYVKLEQYDLALEVFQKAVDLNPNVIDTHINTYAVAVLIGDGDLEKKEYEVMNSIKPGFFEDEYILTRFLPLFRQAGRLDRVEEDLKKLIEINPEKVEYFSSLAILYAEQGKNSLAEQTIRLLKGRDTTLDTEIDKFIKKIYAGDFVK